MEPVIVRITESVEIAAPAAEVFELVSDPVAKTRLNPFLQVIRIERENSGPLQVGEVTFLRLQKGTRIFEYRTRCVRLESGRLLENQAELPTLFRVRMEVEPLAGATRLRQTEECEVTRGMLEKLPVPPRAERAWRAIKILTVVLPMLGRETYAMIARERVAALRTTMGRELQVWLQAIKRHLEAPRGPAGSRFLERRPECPSAPR